MISTKAWGYWVAAGIVFLADFLSKAVAVAKLELPHAPHPVIGDLLRFSLAYNSGAAMGIRLGASEFSVRLMLSIITAAVIVALVLYHRRLAPHDRAKAIAAGLITGGALGNLVDRIRHPLGVVDFIDVGIGPDRFWTFNVADIGISLGAVMLAAALTHDDRLALRPEPDSPG